MLTEEQIAHFYREGYILIRQLIPQDSIDSVMEEARTRLRDGDKWQPSIFDSDNIENISARDRKLHQLLWHPNMIAATQDLLGTPPRVYYGMLAVVPAKGGNGLPWHQDNQYTHILGGIVNVFVALMRIPPEMATLWIAPQSHRLGRLESKENTTTAPGHRESLYEPPNAIQLPTLEPGDTCIFDRNTLHRSLINTTDKDRFAYSAHFQSNHARLAETGARETNRMLAAELAELMSR